MVEKNKKLHDQFDAQASNSSNGGSSSSENAIFRGVSIFVDGFTVPSSQVYFFLCYFPLTIARLAEN